MHERARMLIETLDLEPHPEGGHFREMFRSQHEVMDVASPFRRRSALTAIYFLLVAGERSRWHRVASDEAWHYHEGDPLELVWVTPGEAPQVRRVALHLPGPASDSLAIVPAGCWQAARPLGAFTLAGCAVGPGFDFADFELLEAGAERDRLRRCFGAAREFE